MYGWKLHQQDRGFQALRCKIQRCNLKKTIAGNFTSKTKLIIWSVLKFFFFNWILSNDFSSSFIVHLPWLSSTLLGALLTSFFIQIKQQNKENKIMRRTERFILFGWQIDFPSWSAGDELTCPALCLNAWRWNCCLEGYRSSSKQWFE